jgi:uncharacterized membrane protein
MTPSRRLAFIDLLRGWAVIVMIETHVFNATILKTISASAPFEVLTFINGLVAPSFLFASGMAYAVTTRRKLPSYLHFGPPLFKQLGRLLFILAIGYALHLPKFNLRQLLAGVSEEQWLVFFQADVLQCIAVCLLFLQVLLLMLRTERRLYLAISVISVIVLLVTPLMWGSDLLLVFPAPLAAYMNGLHFSLFPLFPWSVFLFAGAIAGYLFSEAREGPLSPGSPRATGVLTKRFAGAGIGLLALSLVLMPLGGLYPTYDYWRFSPGFVLLRLGIVFFLCAVMFWYEQRNGVGPRSPVALMGRESLLVYATHLLLIYGNFGTFNFRIWAGQALGYAEAAMWTVLLLVLMLVLAYGWDRVRRADPWMKRWIQLTVLAVFVGVFLFGPGQ